MSPETQRIRELPLPSLPGRLSAQMAVRLSSPAACAAREASLRACNPPLVQRRAGLKPPASCTSCGRRRLLPTTVAASGRPEQDEDTPDQDESTQLTFSSRLMVSSLHGAVQSCVCAHCCHRAGTCRRRYPAGRPLPSAALQGSAGDAVSFALLAPIHLAVDGIAYPAITITVVLWRLPVAFYCGLACTLAWKPLPGVGGSPREIKLRGRAVEACRPLTTMQQLGVWTWCPLRAAQAAALPSPLQAGIAWAPTQCTPTPASHPSAARHLDSVRAMVGAALCCLLVSLEAWQLTDVFQPPVCCPAAQQAAGPLAAGVGAQAATTCLKQRPRHASGCCPHAPTRCHPYTAAVRRWSRLPWGWAPTC